MATHETGELVDDEGGPALSTHEEHEYEQDRHDNRKSSSNRSSSLVESPSTVIDEEAAIGTHVNNDGKETPNNQEGPLSHNGAGGAESGPRADKFELQDQTNLLPVRQVIAVFMGLNCALFCSLLDQTM
jgi:hypothetical protein